MKRHLLLTLAALLLIAALLNSPQSAKAYSNLVSYSFAPDCSSITVTASTNQPYVYILVLYGGHYGVVVPANSSGIATGTVHYYDGVEGSVITVVLQGATDSLGTWDHETYFVGDLTCRHTNLCVFTDGRLNCRDAAQTAAVYCNDDGSVEVKAIFDGKGYPAFTASPAEIAKVPTHPAKNTLIKQGNGAFLYRLTSGELQVNRRQEGTPAKDYSFRFSCS